jgi:hypothetical protein
LKKKAPEVRQVVASPDTGLRELPSALNELDTEQEKTGKERDTWKSE